MLLTVGLLLSNGLGAPGVGWLCGEGAASKETPEGSFAELTTEASEFATMRLPVLRTLQVI